MINWRKNVITKKLIRYSLHIPRYVIHTSNRNGRRESGFPILANSIPKSGTHLLINILKSLPSVRDWGNFLASTPSFTFRELSLETVRKKIEYFVPNELIGAHLFYNQETDAALRQKQVIHYFVYRDPRDIVVSEAHYLAEMNRWHFLHSYFKSLPDMESRIELSIKGLGDLPGERKYPNIAKRLSYFIPWINNGHVFAIKYEELISDKKTEAINGILTHYASKQSVLDSKENLIEQILKNINPKNSHTFRTGKAGNWKTVFTERQKDLFKEIAGDLLIELGYEKDYNW
ncbi:MAG TPA: hypothetical protein ENK44_03480 [Caldithrix abyssi]|uniref:Sulfotransferase domain-containing protein n=1 Tax=Caldithrix abyssi TaxID=187145 RepID=A0A7V4UCG2_CALAY|nr:hypothetical protein [Caldithrix abyssi]